MTYRGKYANIILLAIYFLGDALFNVPAFLTVDKWSKNGASTFLYSFEHLGKLKKGPSFLRGSPMIGNETYNEGEIFLCLSPRTYFQEMESMANSHIYIILAEMNDTIAHGDELAYIFDVNDIEGNPIESDRTLSEEDQKVRDVFTQMIADFARSGKPKVGNKEVLPFSGKSSMSISFPTSTILNYNDTPSASRGYFSRFFLSKYQFCLN